MKILDQIQEFFYRLHDEETNQKYNKGDYPVPYSFHLHCAEKNYWKFRRLIPKGVSMGYSEDIVYKGVVGHDSLENCDLSFNDLKAMYGEEVAEVIFLCTDYTGRTRDERKPMAFYIALSKNKLAIFVKLCDIMANTKFSLLMNSDMFLKYKKEYFEKVKPYLYCEEYKEMFDYLEKIYALEN